LAPAPAPSVAPTPTAPGIEAGRTPFPSDGLAAPLVSAPTATRQPTAVNMPAGDSRKSDT
jgi:hypothetical protein